IVYPSGPHGLAPPVHVRPRPAEVVPAALARPAVVNPGRRSLLVVDHEPELLKLLVRMLSGEFEVLTAGSADDAQAVFGDRAVDIILTDQRMPWRTGVQLLEWVSQHHPHTFRLLITPSAEFDDTVEAINRAHIYHYIAKPWGHAEALLQPLRNAAEKCELERNREQLLAELQRANDELQEANHQLLLR